LPATSVSLFRNFFHFLAAPQICKPFFQSAEDPRGIFSFVDSEQIKGCPLGVLPRHPPRRARNP
jgi:hypothetical protein